MEISFLDRKFLDQEGLAKVFEIIKNMYYTKGEVDELIPEGGGEGGSCDCPDRWTYLGAVEFEASYTTTDNQKLDLPVTRSVLMHEWSGEENKGKLKFDSNGIPKQFFYLQERLKTIDLVSPCPKVGDEAFRGCTNLEQITLGDSVIKLGVRAFQNCQPINNVVIPEGVTEIPEACFIGCHITTTDSAGNKSYKDGLKTITLPDSLESIGKEAFEDCTGLVNLKMPKNVKRIASRAFQQCEKLTITDWEFFQNLEELEEKAFQSCHNLNFPDGVLDVPEKLTELKPEVFSYCYGIKEVKLHDNITSLASKAFYSTGYYTGGNRPLVIEKINIPSSVKFIGKQCFASDRQYDGYNSSQQGHVRISNIDVQDINDYVQIEFEDSNSHPNRYDMTPSSTFRETIITVNGEALPENLEITAPITELDQNMFAGIKNIVNVKMPSRLERIGTRAFMNSTVKSVDCSNSPSLSFIGNNTFSGTTMNSLNLSGCDLSEIEERAFSGMTVTELNLSNSKLTSMPMGCTASVINLSGSKIEGLPHKCFNGSSNLTSIDFSNCSNLKNIGDSNNKQIFYGCEYLANVNVSGCVNLETIGEQAFSGCYSLETMDLSGLSKLKTIDRKAFEKCEYLKSVNLTGCVNLETIGEQAFYGGSSSASGLEEIDLSVCPKLTTLGNKVFPHVKTLTVSDTAPYLGEMERWTSNASSPTPTSNSVLVKVNIKGASKVVDGLYLTKPTYYVDETLLEQYKSKYPALTFSKLEEE